MTGTKKNLIEPFMTFHHRAKAVGSDQNTDQDETDDRGDPEPRKDGNNNPRRAQNNERIGHYR